MTSRDTKPDDTPQPGEAPAPSIDPLGPVTDMEWDEPTRESGYSPRAMFGNAVRKWADSLLAGRRETSAAARPATGMPTIEEVWRLLSMDTGAPTHEEHRHRVDLRNSRIVGLVPALLAIAEGAAAAGARAETELAEALDALDELHDWQNGPPLIKYEKEWHAADQKASAVLRKHGRLTQALGNNDNEEAQ